FFFSSRRRHTRFSRDWSSDVCSSDLPTPRFEIAEGNPRSFPEPTVRRGAATCLKCGYTIPVEHVREQLSARSGGAPSALLVAVEIGRASCRESVKGS